MFRPTFFKTIRMAIVLLSVTSISFKAYAMAPPLNSDASKYDKNISAPKNNSSAELKEVKELNIIPKNNSFTEIDEAKEKMPRVHINECVVNPGQCSCASGKRAKTCEDAYNFCNQTYYGNGDLQNRYAGISKDEFKAAFAECSTRVQNCLGVIIDEEASCCCHDSNSSWDVRPTLGPDACAKASINMNYYCKMASNECQMYYDRIKDQENFSAGGLNHCAYDAFKCYQWSLTKSQRCSCGQNQ